MEHEFKGTAGEWFASGREIVSMPSQCKITNRVGGWSHEEAKANANLIAQAPDLLEACIDVYENFQINAIARKKLKKVIDRALNK